MARFGLDSDSSDDELPHASGSGSAHSSGQESEDEAPPRASLAQSDDDMTDDYDNDNSQLDQDEDEDEEEDDESEGYVEEPSYLAQRARSSTRAVSQTPSAANLGDDEEFTEDEEMSASDAGTEDSTRTVADQLAVRKSASVAGSVRSEAWGKKLGLEPKRVAVMQASFFHQGDEAGTAAPKVNGLGGLKRTGLVLNPFANKPQPGLAPEAVAAVSTASILSCLWLANVMLIESLFARAGAPYVRRASDRPGPVPPAAQVRPRRAGKVVHQWQGSQPGRRWTCARSFVPGRTWRAGTGCPPRRAVRQPETDKERRTGGRRAQGGREQGGKLVSGCYTVRAWF
jgi:hypothetical protein